MMEKINENIRAFTAINALFLLFQAFVLGVMLLASGHRINFQDEAQIKFIIEIVVFALSSIILFLNIEKLRRFNIQVFICLVLVVFSVLDILRDILKEIEIPIPFMIHLLLLYCMALLGLNILLFVSQVSCLFGD